MCEVPGWGYQLEPQQVLAEMREVGLAATELGPDGFLPTDPDELAATLDEYGLVAVGGFTPVLVHEAGHDPVPDIAGLLEAYIAAKAEVMVLAAVTGVDGYDSRPELDDDGWKTLLHNLDRLHDAAAESGIRAVLHPHVGTMIENKDEVTRVLDGSTIPLCLDTGHLLIGGTNPVELVGAAADRITHTHLKDVHADYAARVQSGELTYTQAVAQGMYTPLGTGDADIAGVVTHLLDPGLRGLVHPGTRHHPAGRARGRGTRRRRAQQRRLPAQPYTVSGLRIGVLGASRIAELAVISPAAGVTVWSRWPGTAAARKPSPAPTGWSG